MESEKWREIKFVFARALDLNPASRQRFVDELDLDESVKLGVNALLNNLNPANASLERLLSGARAEHGDSPGLDSLSIDGYGLLRRIAGGGMGDVYEATQLEPARRVAIKVIKRELMTSELTRRFEFEGQALALMNHRNVASIFEAGLTSVGSPYFAMEYVDGLSITEYCDQHKLTVRERMTLFVQACDGVRHAHQKGIIHRDLKPSNILVTIPDGEAAVVKIIDFGIAKADPATELVAAVTAGYVTVTSAGSVIGTLAYMSPEQADQSGARIDTRADVYSLGVVLFELLVGLLPIEIEGYLLDSPARALDRIRTESVPKPSTLVQRGNARAEAAAGRRSTTVDALRRRIAGDLDSIAMRALEKDPARRYGSVAELSNDVNRHLRLEPITARPARFAYRMGRFVQRNLLSMALVTALVFLAGAFAADRAFQLKRIAEEGGRAKAVLDFLSQLLLATDPDETGRAVTTVRELLEQGALKARDSLAGQQDVQSEVQTTLGRVFLSRGLIEEARPLLNDAVSTRRRRLGFHPSTAESISLMANLLQDAGEYVAAESACREALAMRRRTLGETHADVISSLGNLALILHDQGRFSEAEPLHRDALERAIARFGNDHKETTVQMNNLANNLSARRRFAEAAALHRNTLSIRRRILGNDHPRVASSLSNLAMALEAMNELAESVNCLTEAAEIRVRVLGESHPSVAIVYNNLGVVQARTDVSVALVSLGKALAINRAALGAEHPDVAMGLHNVGYILATQGRFEEAEINLREALRIRRRVYGENHQLVGLTSSSLGDVLAASRSDWNSALLLYRSAHRAYSTASGPHDLVTAATEAKLGVALRRLGQSAGADIALTSSIKTLASAGDLVDKTLDRLTTLHAGKASGAFIVSTLEAEAVRKGFDTLARKIGNKRPTFQQHGRKSRTSEAPRKTK